MIRKTLTRGATWLLVVALSSLSASRAFADDLQNPVIVLGSGVASSSTLTPGETFTVTYRLTDDVGCCNYHQAWLYDPAGASIRQVSPALVSGSSTDGNFRASFSLPSNAGSGSYTVKAQATDLTGKYTHLQLLATVTVGTPSVTPPIEPPVPTPSDTQNPVVVVGSGNVSTSSALPGASFFITYQVTDDLDCCGYHQAWLYNPSGANVSQVTPALQSGDNKNGTFRATFTIPSNSGFGTYEIKAQATDKAGKYTHLQLLGSIAVVSTVISPPATPSTPSTPIAAPAPAPAPSPTGTASPNPIASPTPTPAVVHLAAPKRLSVTNIAKGKALLVWSAPTLNEGQSVTGYRLQYRLKSAVSWKTLTVKGNSFALLYGLAAKKTYNVRIAAVAGATVSKNLLNTTFSTK